MERKTDISVAIIHEMSELLEKMAVDAVTPVVADPAVEVENQEALLINLKAINARYDKHEAIEHVSALMEKYNIQIDELAALIPH